MDESPEAVFGRLVTAGPPERPGRSLGAACVLGGSIAGLLAARVLADHAERVVVIDRDPVGGDTRPRAGVPQGRQLHALLPGGFRWMQRWFPGFTREMRDAGALIADPDHVVSLGRQRWAMAQIIRAAIVDEAVAGRFLNVAYMLAHPGTLAEPGLLARAIAVNEGRQDR